MHRELHDTSAEERMGADLFISRGDAFHKKIILKSMLGPLPEGFIWGGPANDGPNGEKRPNYVVVVPDDVPVPSNLEIVESVEYAEGADVGKPYLEANPPYGWYKDEHYHGLNNASVGGIPVRQVKLE